MFKVIITCVELTVCARHLAERETETETEIHTERCYLILTQHNEITSHFLDKETRHSEIDNLSTVTQLIIIPSLTRPKVMAK